MWGSAGSAGRQQAGGMQQRQRDSSPAHHRSPSCAAAAGCTHCQESCGMLPRRAPAAEASAAGIEGCRPGQQQHAEPGCKRGRTHAQPASCRQEAGRAARSAAPVGQGEAGLEIRHPQRRVLIERAQLQGLQGRQLHQRHYWPLCNGGGAPLHGQRCEWSQRGWQLQRASSSACALCGRHLPSEPQSLDT